MAVEAEAISINITFKNTQSTDALKSYAEEKLRACLQKFVRKPVDAHVILSVAKNRQVAEVTLRSDGTDFFGKEESDSLYTALDALVDSIAVQLRKHKDKLTAHH